MSLEFVDGWEAANTSRPEISQEDIRDKTVTALGKLATTDEEFKYLISMALGTSNLTKAKVTKGLHQEEGNSLIPDSHITLEVPIFPRPKRFHLYFWYIRKGKTTSWYPYRLTHIEGNARKSVDLN